VRSCDMDEVSFNGNGAVLHGAVGVG
jgi:hypothetical protein